jgi:hypothetical protein
VLSEGGAIAPVQWKGYSEALGKYQGEVLHKERIRSAFRRKIARCRANPKSVNSTDWTGLRMILEVVFCGLRVRGGRSAVERSGRMHRKGRGQSRDDATSPGAPSPKSAPARSMLRTPTRRTRQGLSVTVGATLDARASRISWIVRHDRRAIRP